MTREEFMNQITAIGTCEDDVQRRSLLADLQTEASSLYDTNENLTNTNQTLTQDNEDLRSANMKLFLQIGNPEGNDGQNQNKGGQNPPEKRSFENLFDEKGGIK